LCKSTYSAPPQLQIRSRVPGFTYSYMYLRLHHLQSDRRMALALSFLIQIYLNNVTNLHRLTS